MDKIEVNNKEFEIVKLLGKGKGGYSYLITCKGNQYVLKQIHHEPCDYYQFGNKIESEINDYFPTNFVVQNELIYYIDYECNNYMEEWNFENWGIKQWSKTEEFLEYVRNHNVQIL